MCEITRRNFEEKFQEIIEDLRSAACISFDCEFSGFFHDDCMNSLFDSPKVRFNKLQQCLQNVLIIQMGLSTFKYERESNVFTSSVYNFYLLPSSTVLPNFKLMCQAGSIGFLCKQNFDFNKLFYEGIAFLNKSDESKVLRMIEDDSITRTEELKEMQKYCSEIAEWSSRMPQGSEMLLELKENNTFVYLLHWEIRKRFPSLWTYLGEPGVIKIRKLEEADKKKLAKDVDNSNLKKILFDSILGFSRIMKEIENLKKPFIGHNCLIDLIMIYKQFYNSSPVSYKEFKKAVTSIFPTIYDTKFLSFGLREILPREDYWHSNILSDLYYYLTVGKGSFYVISTPTVHQTNEKYLKKESFHEAGYDSYCTGFCFLKIAHIFSLWDENKRKLNRASLPTSLCWLFGAVDSKKNKVNLTRGHVNYISLSGQDPRSSRPDLIFIRSKTKSPLDISKILDELAKYGSLDIQIFNKYSAVLAGVNWKQVSDISDRLKKNEDIEVDKYSFLKHSPKGRMITSATVIASVVLTAVVISKVWR